MLPFLYHDKYSFQIYRNTNNKNEEIQISELQIYNLQICRNIYYSTTEIPNLRNTTCRSAEIQTIFTEILLTFEFWVTFELWVDFELWVTFKGPKDLDKYKSSE